jgi:hypothetical protein
VIASLRAKGGSASVGKAVSLFQQIVLALIGSVTLVNSASGQAPGLLWSTKISANLFAVDEQTNLYANRGGDVIVLNGSGVPQQTNTICPLPGLAGRDSAGNYLYTGLLDGTQNFGGITLVGGYHDPYDRGNPWVPGDPSLYVAKYGATGQLHGAAVFATPGPPFNYVTNTISDLLPDLLGGSYIGYSGGLPSLAHFDGLKINWSASLALPDPRPGGGKSSARLSGASVSNCFYSGFFSGMYWAGNALLAGNFQNFSSWLTAADVATNGVPVIDDSGKALVIGVNYNTSQQVLRKYSVSGSTLLEVNVLGEAQWTLGRDSQAGLYAGGASGTLFKYYLNDGTFIWSTNLGKVCVKFLVDGTGNRFVSFADGSFGRLQPDPAPLAPSNPVGPQSQTVFLGDPVVMSVTASGTPPFQYSWSLNGTSLAGATTSAFQLASAAASNSGSYTVTLSNPAGSITSAPALLRVKSVAFYLGNQLLTNGTYVFSAPPTLTVHSAFVNGASFYTLDGSSPSFASSRYSSPLLVSKSATVRAIGYSADFSQSDEADALNVVVLERHFLSVSTPGGGTVTVNPPGNSFLNTNIVTVTAAPSPGWTLLCWLGDASGSNPVVTVSMEKDKTLQAVFGTALGTTSVGGGQVLLDPPGGIYPYGSVVRLTAVPQAGEYFGAWGNAGTGNLNPLYFTVTNASQTVSSIFGPIPGGQSTLTVLINGHGRVTVSPIGNAYPTGQMLTATPLPEPGQSFLSWSGAVTGNQNPLSLSLSQSLTITANFTSHAFLRTDRRGLEGLTPDGFRFTLVSDAPSVWQILGSTNLSFWENLGAITNSLGEVQFLDPGSIGRAERLYRALQQ